MTTPQCPICKDTNCAEFKRGWSMGFNSYSDLQRPKATMDNRCLISGWFDGVRAIDQAADDAFQAQYSFHTSEY